MAQYYQIQNEYEIKQIYADVQVVQVGSDDVGQLLLQDDQILLNDGQQVVYQTTSAPTNQTPYPQATTTTQFIIGDEIAHTQQQQQQQSPQSQQHPQLMLQPHQSQHHQQQQQLQQQHYQRDPQAHPQQLQVLQQQQDQQHQLPQHVQTQQHQQIYYTTEQLLPQNNIVQQQQQQQQQEMQQQQMQHVQQQQQFQQQQHLVHQQQHAMQAATQPQQHIVYRMQPASQQQQQSSQLHQQTQMLNNAHVIVQQSAGQQLLIQSPTHQDIIMRQPLQQQQPQQQQPQQSRGIVYNTNRVLYQTPTTSSQPQSMLQQTVSQQHPQPSSQQQQQHQQHIQLQTSPLQTQTRLVPARLAPQQTQQQMTQGVVFHQLQTTQKAPPPPQQLQIQTQQQLPVSNMRGGVLRGGKTSTSRVSLSGGTLGTTALVARLPGAVVRPMMQQQPASATVAVRVPRPRGGGGATTGGLTRGRGAPRGSRSGIMSGTSRGTQLVTGSGGQMQHMVAQQQQSGMINMNQKHINIVHHNGQRQLYRTTQVVESTSMVQQPQLQFIAAGGSPQQRPQTVSPAQTPPRFRSSSSLMVAPTQQSHSQQQLQTTSGGNNFDLDLEDSIQAVVVKREQQKVLQGTSTIVGPPVVGTTLTTYYTAKQDDDENRLVRTQNGTCMTLAEYRKRNAAVAGTNASSALGPTAPPMRPLISMRTVAQPLASTPKQQHGAPTGQTINVARVTPQPQHAKSTPLPPSLGVEPAQSAAAAPSSVHQTSHNNYEIQTQHVLQNRTGQQMADKDRNSAKMLVILVSGEQRLITFTLPRESCTVQDLLEQVGVPFDNNTTIQCVENPGANIDFVVTVGFSVQESPSELISRAELSLQMSRQQEGSQLVAATTPSVSTTTNSAASVNTVTAATSYSNTPSPVIGAEEAAAKEAATEEITARKVIHGYYAVCHGCGFSGYDHARCERCKRVFSEPPKKVPCVRSVGCETPSLSSRGAAEYSEKKPSRPTGDIMARLSKVGITYSGPTPTGGNTRGRGMSGRGRSSRGGRRAAEAEPIILTLSSDEEDNDDASNKDAHNFSNAQNTSGMLALPYKPFSFEPAIPDEDESDIYAGNMSLERFKHTFGTIDRHIQVRRWRPKVKQRAAQLGSNFLPKCVIGHNKNVHEIKYFKRDDVTDLSNCEDKLSTTAQCRIIRIGTYRYEPKEPVIFTSKGIRIIAPLISNPSENCTLDIGKREVVKIIAHFSGQTSLLCLYTRRQCARYIKMTLRMTDTTLPLDHFSPNGPYQLRKVIFDFDNIPETACNVIKSIWDCLDEISLTDAHDLLHRADVHRQLITKRYDEPQATTTQLNTSDIRQLLIYPSGKGGISINMDDYMCLATDQYLNDIIIDFYLKWVHINIISDEQRDNTFIFSTFFYKRLTTLTRHHQNLGDVRQTAAQKRHARVQNWTKNVNLFEKEFIIIPINEQSHWFLAIICYPKFSGPVTYDTHLPVEPQHLKKPKGKKIPLRIGNTTITPLSKRESSHSVPPEVSAAALLDDDSERDEAEGDDSDLASDDSDFDGAIPSSSLSSSTAMTSTSCSSSTHATGSGNNNSHSAIATTAVAATTSAKAQEQAIKQPLILIFDSLAGASRSRVVATLRDYLTCEYKAKMPESGHSPPHSFNKDNMPGHCVKVPQQNNFTDCGLYLLQYVEQFFKDPIRNYRMPIKQLTNWFDTLTVTRKREDISILLQRLMNEKNGPTQKLLLPEIPFPTLNGQLVEPPEGYSAEFEEEEMEEEAVEEDEDNSAAADDGMDSTSADELNGVKRTPPSAYSPASTTSTAPSASTKTTLVPTHGRKIVVKRRLHARSGSSSNEPPTPPRISSPIRTQKQRKMD